MPLPLSLRGAERRGNPHPLRQGKTKSNYSRRIRSYYEFAISIASLPGFPAGKRIAAPVCALVRNDMLKEEACARVQGRLARKVRRNLPGVSVCKDAGRDDTFPLCHCEERSDVAIRIPCGRA